MRKFEILRYIRKFSIWILLLAIVGSYGIYLYGVKNQSYTATAVIKYTNDGIEDGYAPDGTELDVNEIYSTNVIVRAMEELGMSGTPDVIRSKCSVEGIIPDDRKAINEALLEKGEESDYFPDTYRVKLVVDGSMGVDYARNVLDAIIESYCSIYTEKYVEHRLSSTPSKDLLKQDYDFYECIYMLDGDTSEMLDFLSTKKDRFPDFRSSVTGYSYSDLYEIYKELESYEMPNLYALVVDGPQVKNGEILRKSLTDQIKKSESNESVKVTRRKYLKKLMDAFTEQNKSIMDYHYVKQGGVDGSTDYILKNVDEDLADGEVETTYDNLILEYVSLDKEIKAEKVERDNLQYFLNIFSNISASGSGTEASHKVMSDKINAYENILIKYHDIVNETNKELNRYLSADYLNMENSVRVAQAINVNQYVVLAVAFFLIVGVIGSIVVGRAIDIIEYFLYIDKKTGLANRERCDLFIEEKSKKLLTENNTFFGFRLVNLSELTKKYGYSTGDNILSDFAGLINAVIDSTHTTFHNNAGNFIAFLEQCNSKKAEAILNILQEQVDEYNRLNPDYAIKFITSYSTSSDEGIYDVRDLLRETNFKLNDYPKSDDEQGEENSDNQEEKKD